MSFNSWPLWWEMVSNGKRMFLRVWLGVDCLQAWWSVCPNNVWIKLIRCKGCTKKLTNTIWDRCMCLHVWYKKMHNIFIGITKVGGAFGTYNDGIKLHLRVQVFWTMLTLMKMLQKRFPNLLKINKNSEDQFLKFPSNLIFHWLQLVRKKKLMGNQTKNMKEVAAMVFLN